MSCFWKGILSSLSKTELERVLDITGGIAQFVRTLQQKAQATTSVKWNNERLSSKQIEENLEHIKSYNLKQTHSGYWCSSCDPFLLLVCELFQVNINHKYCSSTIKYTVPQPNKTLQFASNRGHFWFVKVVKK